MSEHGSPNSRNCVAGNQPAIAVVIPARDEAEVLEHSIRSLRGSIGPRDEIHVIADHCQDATPAIARRAGASVHVRANGGPVGKGPALHWWMNKTRRGSFPDQIVLVLDADSRVGPGFFEGIRCRFAQGASVVQARVDPSIAAHTPIALMAAFSEIVEQRVYDRLRCRLGWPVRLRGTGMAFRRSILARFSHRLHTLVEDTELTVLLASSRIPIDYLPEIAVTDPKPTDQPGAVRQRARWLKGQSQVARGYPSEILRLLASGPAGWSLLGSVFLKPKTLFLPVKLALVLATLSAAVGLGGAWWALTPLSFFGAMSVLFDFAALLFGLRAVQHKRIMLLALASAPIYALLWVRSIALATVTRQPWLRSRRAPIVQPVRETGRVR